MFAKYRQPSEKQINEIRENGVFVLIRCSTEQNLTLGGTLIV